MIAAIRPAKANGVVAAPPSKSMAHRLLLAAGLSTDESVVSNLAYSRDVRATIDCLKALGATVTLADDRATVRGVDPQTRTRFATLPCTESGSTLRFFLPLCLLSDAPATLTGTATLLSRPLSVYKPLCQAQGLRFDLSETAVTVAGRLQGGDLTLRGDVSSQFITGLLYALPLQTRDSTLTLLPPIESRSYIDLTLSALETFGVRAAWTDETTLHIPGGQRYLPQRIAVEGDWSNAAFLEGLNLLGGQVTVTGLNEDSLQGDRVYRAHFAALQGGTPTISLADCPDLGPVLFALAAAKNGATFTEIGRLRIKESDRVGAMQQELQKLGVKTLASESTLTVYPGLHAPTEQLYGHNDHRIVMALSLLCTLVGGEIAGAEAVGKSFPDYFDRLKQLGVPIDAMDQ